MPIASVLFSFEGRIDRSTYWLKGILPIFGFYVASYLLLLRVIAVAFGSDSFVLVAFGIAMWMTAGWMSIAVTVKRLHDRDKSGWWSLIGLVPIVGIWLLIECGFLEGTDGPNQYGPKPGRGPEPIAAPQSLSMGEMTMQRGRIIFTGSFWGYAIKGLLILILMLILSIPTLGLSLMYIPYWSIKYFFAHMEIELPQPATLEKSISTMDERLSKLEEAGSGGELELPPAGGV